MYFYKVVGQLVLSTLDKIKFSVCILTMNMITKFHRNPFLQSVISMSTDTMTS
jgi:hypothetical protein